MNTLARLRQMKGTALDRMTELNNRARAAGRDLTEAEGHEYSLKREYAEDLNATIALRELEETVHLHAGQRGVQPQNPVAVPPATDEPEDYCDHFRGRDPAAPFLKLS